MTTITTVDVPPQRMMAIEMEIARRLSSQFGRVTSSRNGEYLLPNGKQPPVDVIEQMRKEVSAELDRINIKHETSRRIGLVMKDVITQINIALWLAQASATKDKADIEIARKLVKWMEAMRQTGKKLAKAGDLTFAEDRHWPVPPDNVKKFIDRF